MTKWYKITVIQKCTKLINDEQWWLKIYKDPREDQYQSE